MGISLIFGRGILPNKFPYKIILKNFDIYFDCASLQKYKSEFWSA